MQRYQRYTGCDPQEALEAATHRPASLLGISERKGSLSLGADADLYALDDSLIFYAIDL